MGEGKVISLSGTGRQKQARWGKGYKPLQDKKKSLKVTESRREAVQRRQSSRVADHYQVQICKCICVELRGFERV